MALRSGGRNLSFEILSRNRSLDQEQPQQQPGLFSRSNSDPIAAAAAAAASDHHKPRRKRKKKKRTAAAGIPESPKEANAAVGIDGLGFSFSQTTVLTTELHSEPSSSFAATELRQRSVNANAGGSIFDETTPSAASEGEGKGKEEMAVSAAAAAPVAVPNGSLASKLQTVESLDWQRVMAEDPNYMYTMDKSPLKYFMEEMSNGNSLRSTTTLGNEKERERVYDTIF